MKLNPKEILNKYATEVVKTDAIYISKGRAGVDANKSFSYKQEKYDDKIVLWKAPNNWIRIEFDGVDANQVRILVSETESNLKALDMDYCITFHDGGVSPYINICNIKNIPLNEQNKDAKLLLLDLILSANAKKVLDKGNLTFTWTPVIGHQHWKPKYNGAIHELKKGTNPLDQVNEYPANLLKELKRSQRQSKKIKTELIRDAGWVKDFLFNYCCNNELPEGNRHSVINKNLAILLANEEDQDKIIERYHSFNDGAGSLRGWIVAYHRGNIKNVSPLELKKYIIDNNIPYDIKEAQETKVEGNTLEKAIKVFLNKKDLAEQFIKIQPLFYDEARNFWIWNKLKKGWERKDDVHMFNLISHNTTADTINSKEKNEIIEALKQVGRLHQPKPFKINWIQFEDTIVDIKNGEMFDSTPKYFCTNPIPYSLSDTEETPIIDSLFKEWVGKDYVKTLKQIMAYCMLSDYPIHRIFCFLGSGRNGKSKYLKLIKRLLGKDNVSSVELDTLMSSRFEMFNLYKKLACQMGETNFSTMSRTAVLKKLTGQDLISFEAKNKDSIQEENYAKLLISTNSLPSTDDKSDGFYRRWIVIDFPNQFPEGKEILDKIPEKEYNNFCFAAIDILRELLDEGKFYNEGTIEERKRIYEEKSNPFDKFTKERCEFYSDDSIFKYEFRDEFKKWCENNGFRMPSDRDVASKMKDKDVDSGKMQSEVYNNNTGDLKRYTCWNGIGWKDSGLHKKATEDLLMRTSEEKQKEFNVY